VQSGLKQGTGARGSLSGGSLWCRNGLVIAEVSLAVVLAIGAGLLFRSLLALHQVELGYRPESLLVMNAHKPAGNLEEYKQAGRSFQELIDQLRNVGGIKAVGAAMGLPASRYGSNGSYIVEGRHKFEPGYKLPEAGFRLTSPGYFGAMGVPVLAGRDFSATDHYDAPFVAVISQALARETFPGEDPLGKRIMCGLDSPNWMTVVGVVGDVRQSSPAAQPQPELYMPLQQHPYFANEVEVVLRTGLEPGALVEDVRRQAQALDPQMAVRFTTMRAMLSESVAAPRFRTYLLLAFAGVALLLSMTGVYGVMAYFVSQRTPEMGLRMALGARPLAVLSLVLGRAALLAGTGLVLGLGASLALARVLESLLFSLQPRDPATYAAVLVGVALVAAGAAYLPARRATRIDPLEALRQE
jgi:putative ABC transport system permease protein